MLLDFSKIVTKANTAQIDRFIFITDTLWTTAYII